MGSRPDPGSRMLYQDADSECQTGTRSGSRIQGGGGRPTNRKRVRTQRGEGHIQGVARAVPGRSPDVQLDQHGVEREPGHSGTGPRVGCLGFSVRLL